MDDLISRAVVVDAIEGVDWYHINKNGDLVSNCYDCPMNPDGDAWMR